MVNIYFSFFRIFLPVSSYFFAHLLLLFFFSISPLSLLLQLYMFFFYSLFRIGYRARQSILQNCWHNVFLKRYLYVFIFEHFVGSSIFGENKIYSNGQKDNKCWVHVYPVGSAQKSVCWCGEYPCGFTPQQQGSIRCQGFVGVLFFIWKETIIILSKYFFLRASYCAFK